MDTCLSLWLQISVTCLQYGSAHKKMIDIYSLIPVVQLPSKEESGFNCLFTTSVFLLDCEYNKGMNHVFSLFVYSQFLALRKHLINILLLNKCTI